MVATMVAAVPTSSYAAPGDSPRPTWPEAGVTATVSNLTDTTATLTLSTGALDAGTITAYNVYGGAGNTDLLGTSATTTINLTGLAPETAYNVHVEAVDNDGNSSVPLTGTNFSVPVVLSSGTGSSPYSIGQGLFNAGSDIDLVVANESSDTVGVLLGSGDGSFATVAQDSVGSTPDGEKPKNLALGLVNGDAHLDIVTANEGSNKISVLLGDGAGDFTLANQYAAPSGTHGVTIGAFDGTAGNDVIAVGWDADVPAGTPPPPPADPNGGFFFSGNNDGTFDPSVEFAEGPASHQVIAADFDDIAGLDLAIADLEDTRILHGNNDGTFAAPSTLVGPGQAHDVAMGSFNGDADEDLAIVSQNTNQVAIFFGLTGLAFTDSDIDEYDVADNPKGVTVGDVNNDGVDDVIAASVGTNIVDLPAVSCIAPDDSVTLLLGNGTGTFSAWAGSYGGAAGALVPVTNGQIPMGKALFDATVADFNGDGWNDITAPAWCDNEVVIRLGLGEGGPSASFTTNAAVAGAPSAPAAPTASAGDTEAAVSWVAPASNGSAITGYDLQVENLTTPGVTSINAGLVLTRLVTGLANDDGYRARVRAVNSIGVGAWSPWSATFTPTEGAVINPFTDTEDSVFKDDIIWLANEGITKGCNPPTNNLFCPDDDVTREQMAAFLVRALGLTDDGGGNTFLDVPAGSTFENDIAKLATAGITKGCNPPANTNFCPGDTVTREQMAAFMVRALGLTDDGGGNTFTDVPAGSTFENDIAKLATAGITKGCNPPTNTNFCPGDNVTRGQMAAFMRRALG
jgi:hypothetical protein